MKTKSGWGVAPWVAVAIFFAGTIVAQAEAVSELSGLSVFQGVNLAELAKGDAQVQRGPAMSNSRFQSVQSVWISSGSPAQVIAAMKSFNPARHSELKVLLHTNGSNFSQLNKVPGDESVQWLQNATAQKSTDLQISNAEAAKSGGFAQFWSGILSARASAGVFGQPAYDHTGQNIRPGEEINSLLAQQPKIRKQFSGLIGSKGEQYWELVNVDRKGVLTLGTSFTRASNGAEQAADVLYYASGGYYVGLTLYQMWPVTVAGRASTLVWRVDLISSGELADLHGVEKLGSESAMLKDVSRSIRAFRSDSGGSR